MLRGRFLRPCRTASCTDLPQGAVLVAGMFARYLQRQRGFDQHPKQGSVAGREVR